MNNYTKNITRVSLKVPKPIQQTLLFHPEFGMNPAPTSYKTFSEAEDNAGVASKQSAGIRKVNLNDGNEIPMVSFLLYDALDIADIFSLGMALELLEQRVRNKKRVPKLVSIES
jgi:hypothetical protein